ncbi:MAG: hypothetical protein M3134_06825, partial [Actinomycetota bacterium]|nr:hypothetical protein [Actinomycetota bacterium]
MADVSRARRAVGWMARLLVIGGLGGAYALLGATPAGASPCDVATITWDGGAGTTAWTTAANWTGDRLPGADDHVCIPAGTGTVSQSGTTSIQSIEARKPFTITGTLSLTSVTVDSWMTGGSIGGTLNGPGLLQLDGIVSWTGGEMKSLGVTRVLPGAQLNITAQRCCSNRPIGSNYTLIVDGTLSIAGGEGLNVGENFQIRNNGRIEWTPTYYSEILDVSAATAVKPSIVNNGTIVKTSGDNRAIGIPLWNQAGGVVRSEVGTLTLSAGSGGNSSSGTFGPGLVLSGTNTLSGATFTGTGNEIYGTYTLPAGSTTTLAPGSTTTLSATVNGPGKLAVGGTLTWTGGPMQNGGTTEVA